MRWGAFTPWLEAPGGGGVSALRALALWPCRGQRPSVPTHPSSHHLTGCRVVQTVPCGLTEVLLIRELIMLLFKHGSVHTGCEALRLLGNRVELLHSRRVSSLHQRKALVWSMRFYVLSEVFEEIEVEIEEEIEEIEVVEEPLSTIGDKNFKDHFGDISKGKHRFDENCTVMAKLQHISKTTVLSCRAKKIGGVEEVE
ncbi:hypothetical protein llap_11691 [Limosa lapponica baueri]|uniref:Uncharacterized protein n=1 Tax=Limosa lapponica baueri TaxID=1758121 RepID=A0A2I0TW16_LIMLA|nr:hypothetical protein llap_11691 [Limosa lapponica baueri]